MMYHHGDFGGPGCGWRGDYRRRGRGSRGWDLDEDELYDAPRPVRMRSRARLLKGLFRRLDTTPGQEKALRELVEGLGNSLGDARSDFAASRLELASALSGESIDTASLDRAFQRNAELLAKLSSDLKIALQRAHQTLDSEQRKYLAELIGRGGFGASRFERHAFEL